MIDRGRKASFADMRIAPANAAPPIVAARPAYDQFARRYDNWDWQEFWRNNEWPHIRGLVASAPRSAAILDVGVGTGFYLSQLVAPSRTIYGLDISLGMLRVARERLPADVFLVQADALHIPFAAQRFDIVLLNRVASHVPSLGGLTGELARVLRARGRLIVSDLAPEHDYSCTEFEAPHSRILVETHKHSIDSWWREAAAQGLKMSSRHSIYAGNAAWLPASGFRSIDRSSARPISFVIAFDRV